MYKTECNREFYTFKEKQPKSGDKILVHTINDEVIFVKYFDVNGIDYFSNIDFESSTDKNDIKGWNYWDVL